MTNNVFRSIICAITRNEVKDIMKKYISEVINMQDAALVIAGDYGLLPVHSKLS